MLRPIERSVGFIDSGCDVTGSHGDSVRHLLNH